jgi:long-chain acyl-CoA synthetase
MEKTIPRILRDQARSYPDIAAQLSKDPEGKFQPTSYRLLWDQVITLACGLADIGILRNDRVGIIADNRREWMMADRAILCLGAADVPRGCDSTEREIAYILSFAECRMSFVENRRQLDKMITSRSSLPLLKTLILFDEPEDEDRRAAAEAGFILYAMGEVMERGRGFRAQKPSYVEREVDLGSASETATVIFTSGTTGEPKGVMLSHDNFICQMEAVATLIPFEPGQAWLSILPIWHVFNRLLEYVAMSQANTIAYSKPIAAVMVPDLVAVNPHWLGSVPRVWESLMEGILKTIKKAGGVKARLFFAFLAVGRAYAYCKGLFLGLKPSFGPDTRFLQALAAALPLLILSPINALGELLVFRKIKDKLGRNFTAGLSGGGSLPDRVDRFFRAVGVVLLDGYGLTEAAPALGLRELRHPVWGTVGPALAKAEIRILGEDGRALGHGKRGIIHARGRQVMQGYLKRPELTAAVLSEEGWLNTGDIGMLTRFGELKITGRAKDTIVLSGAENVEPSPIELKLSESPYILQSCVLGQDEKFLGALIVPKEEAVMAFARENDIPAADYESLLSQPEITELFEDEITGLISPKNGFKIYERIVRFALLAEPFRTGRELSLKLDLARHKIAEIHAAAIAGIFARR